MTQFVLFSGDTPRTRIPTSIERDGDQLIIPEGTHTIPATHGLHRFPGKFIPNLPRYLIRELLGVPRIAPVFDPFCGSGTTLVEAALEGHPFLGIDIDPLAVLIASAKTTSLSAEEIENIRRVWESHDYLDGDPSLVPDVPNLEHWFTNVALQQLSSIKRRCLSLPKRERDFSLVVFSSIIRRVSNADDQTQKTYVSGTLKKYPPEPRALFPVFLERALQGMREFCELLPQMPRGSVNLGDARLLNIQGRIGHVVTSPPYIDSIDYMYNQMLEYFWLMHELGLGSYNEFRRLRRIPMGFRRDPAGLHDLYRALGPRREDFERSCSRIAKQSKKEMESVYTFFADYLSHARRIYNLQERSDFYISIVGNSLIRKVVVPTAELLVALHSSVGYELVDRFSYEIRRHYMKFPRRSNSGTIKMDHVLVFRRG